MNKIKTLKFSSSFLPVQNLWSVLPPQPQVHFLCPTSLTSCGGQREQYPALRHSFYSYCLTQQIIAIKCYFKNYVEYWEKYFKYATASRE